MEGDKRVCIFTRLLERLVVLSPWSLKVWCQVFYLLNRKSKRNWNRIKIVVFTSRRMLKICHPTSSMEQRPWASNSHSSSQEIPRLLWNTSASSRARWIQFTTSHPVSLRSHLRLGLPTKFLCYSFPMHATWPMFLLNLVTLQDLSRRNFSKAYVTNIYKEHNA
jgi:hypothetical protein